MFSRFNCLVKRVLQSAMLWTVVGTMLRVGGGIVTLPIALRVIPQAEMGLYYTFLGITAIASLLDFGFASTIARNAAYAMGGAKHFVAKGMPENAENCEPNWLLLGKLKYAVQYWYRILGVVLAVLLTTLGGWFINRQITDAGLAHSLLYCWFVFAASASYGFLTSYWHDLLMGIGEMRSYARNGLISQIIGLMLLICGLLMGGGLWAYAVSSTVASMISRELCKRAFIHNTKIPDNCPLELKATMLDLWPMAWRQGTVMIGAFLIQRCNTLLCSAKLGLDVAGSYGLSLNVLNLILQMGSIPMIMAWPQVGRFRVQGAIGAIRRIFFVRVYLGLGCALVSILLLLVIGPDLLRWMGSRTILLPTTTLSLFGIVMWLEAHHSLYAGAVLSENENPFLLPALLSGLAIFLISWWTAGIWGVTGLIASQGIVQLAWNNWWTVARGLRGLQCLESKEDR